MKICAITNGPCFRWKWEKTVLFCDTCPIALAYEREMRVCNGTVATSDGT
jgi:hypothetical protein